MDKYEKAIELSTELAASIERLTTAVMVLQNTVDHWEMEEEDVPQLLKRQAH